VDQRLVVGGLRYGPTDFGFDGNTSTLGANNADMIHTVTHAGAGLVMNFNMLKPAYRGAATLGVQHSRDIGAGDPWSTVPVTDASSGPTNGVTFIVTPGGGATNAVQAVIGSGEADGTGKLFGRLRALNP
jgi:hypothetical protein